MKINGLGFEIRIRIRIRLIIMGFNIEKKLHTFSQ